MSGTVFVLLAVSPPSGRDVGLAAAVFGNFGIALASLYALRPGWKRRSEWMNTSHPLAGRDASRLAAELRRQRTRGGS